MKTTIRSMTTIALAAVVALAAAMFPDVAAAAVAYLGPETAMALAFVGSTATTITKGKTYTGQLPVNTQPRDSGLYPIVIPIEFPAAAPVANDTHILAKLLPGVEVVDYLLDLEDVDSNGAPTASLSLGEANTALADITTVWKSGITIGQTGGALRYAAATAATGLRAVQAATLANERIIGLKWDTASATYVASKKGLLTLWVRG